MSLVLTCDACGQPIEEQSWFKATLNEESFDFHDSDRCWRRVMAAITVAIAEAQADQ